MRSCGSLMQCQCNLMNCCWALSEAILECQNLLLIHRKILMAWLNTFSCNHNNTPAPSQYTFITIYQYHSLWSCDYVVNLVLVNRITSSQAHCKSIRREWRSWTSSIKRGSAMQASWVILSERHLVDMFMLKHQTYLESFIQTLGVFKQVGTLGFKQLCSFRWENKSDNYRRLAARMPVTCLGCCTHVHAAS